MSARQPIRLALALACMAALAAPFGAKAQVGPPGPPAYAPPPPMQPGPVPAIVGNPDNPPSVTVSTYGSVVPTPGDAAGPAAAQQNVRQSREYEALLRSNPKFRARREAQECGSIADPAAHASCIATFDDPNPGK